MELLRAHMSKVHSNRISFRNLFPDFPYTTHILQTFVACTFLTLAMSHDFEPSIIEYARFHGLIRHHLDPHPLQGLTTPKDFASQLDDPPELFHISLENAKVPEEKLSVDANALSLLSTITESSKPLPSLDDEDVGLHPHRRRRMKHELPLLRSDHELDMLSFASPIVPDLEHELLPLETVDDEEDEGFAWPTRCYDLPDEWTKTARSEKLQISSDAFRYLQQTLSLHLGDEEHGTFEVDDAPHKRVLAVSDHSQWGRNGINATTEARPRPGIATSTTEIANPLALHPFLGDWPNQSPVGHYQPNARRSP